MDNMG